MSGGAFDCVYLQHKNVAELLDSFYVLERMIYECRKQGKQEIANELDKFRLDIESMQNAMEVRFDRIRDLIGAVDYVCAGDTSWEQAQEILDKMNGLKKDALYTDSVPQKSVQQDALEKEGEKE